MIIVNLRKHGFTIVELLIVIVVIAILASISVVAYNGIQTRARNSTTSNELQSIEKAMRLYRVDVGSMPLGSDWYSGSGAPSSRWSTEIIANLRSLGYITGNSLETDAWGQYYIYDNNDCNTGQGGNSYVLSIGADGVRDTSDDIRKNILTGPCS